MSRSRASLLAALLFLLPGAALGQADESETEQSPSDDSIPAAPAPATDVPPTVWPFDGRASCPSLRVCCVPGELECVHPGASRALLATASGGAFGLGTGMFLGMGDSLNSGEPQGQLVGIGLVGLGGSFLGMIADLLTPGDGGTVADRPSRPTARLTFLPGGSSTLDEASPYGLGVSVDPTIALGDHVSLQPHVGVSVNLGQTRSVDPRPQNTAPQSDQETAFPVALTSNRFRTSIGAELSVRLPYPFPVKRPVYSGALEIRWKPMWELRRRTLHVGTDKQQLVEHSALYPVTVGLRWHVAPRQRFTFYVGPRIDWVSFSDPGSSTLRRGPAALGTLYAEAWWQLDIPFSPKGRKNTHVNGRFNVGYLHSHLDGQRLDVGAIVGYFGPLELSFDLRVRRVGAPVAMQVSAGYRIANGGGPFVAVGVVAPTLGKAVR